MGLGVRSAQRGRYLCGLKSGSRAALPVPLMEVVIDPLSHLGRDAVGRLEVLDARTRHGLGRAEVLHERAAAPRADAGNLVIVNKEHSSI